MTLSLLQKLLNASNASNGFNAVPPRFRKQLRPGVWVCLLMSMLAAAGGLRAEGVHQLAPTPDDNVMLLIGSPDFGNFAAYNGPENSRLYIQVREPGETVYLGLSARFNSSGMPQNTGTYFFRIRRAGDGAVVHGPFPVSAASANINGWDDAANGPIALGGSGYATTDDRYRFEPAAAGLYFIEFSGVSYLGHWDITVGKDGQARPGRVYSRNWAFRTPQVANVQPECVWDRTFNGVLYSYTSDGFVTRIDFANSGFQGLSFNVAFNRTGPGTSGDPALDRMSAPNQNLTSNSAEHLIFLTEPDPALFPDGVCGSVSAAPYFRCADGGYCLDVSVTQPGQVEVVLDVDQDGQFDPGQERRLVKVFSSGAPLSDCLYWDGRLADGSMAPEDLSVNLIVSYTQGVQHWALYDGEYLKEGFCVEIIRPLCDVNATANRLYWDDRNITEQPGTDQPADGRTGCDCAADNCRTWNNFQSNNPDCGSINDNLTSGYGDKSTLNTWWFASIVNQTVANVPLRSATLAGPAGICVGSEATLQLNWASSGQIQTIRWEGPQGVLATGGPELTSLAVTAAGQYRIVIMDAAGCEAIATYNLAALNCPADLSLDISAGTAAPGVGEWVQFTILITNEGPGTATQFAVAGSLPAGLVNPAGISHGGVWTGSQLSWPNLQLAPGASLTLTFSALATVALDPNWVVSAEITASAQPDTDSTPGNGQDTDADGLCEDDPGDEDDADCVRLTLGACALEATATLNCDNNGTPTDPDDDRFYAQLWVTATNAGSGWAASGGVTASGAYNQPVTLGPFSIAQGPITLTVRDNFLGGACAQTLTLTPPATCSSECLVSAQAGQIACDDAGTPSRPADDTYGFVLLVTGANVSGQWTTTSGLSGAYGQPITIDAGLISGGNTTLILADAGNPACGTTLVVEAPPSCSNDCEIEPALISNAACNDGGTPADPSDDTFTFDFRLTGYNLSGGWTSGVGLSGAFNETVAMGPYSISAGNVSFVVWDAANPDCRVSVVVTPPAACSNQCRIEAAAANLVCDDAGTPHDAADDTFTFDLLVSGLNNAGPAWTSPQLGLGFFGQTQSMGPYAIGEGVRTFTFQSVSDAGCTFVLPVTPPQTCSDACLISIEGNANTVSNVVCNDAGTPADPSDDIFTFDLRLTGYNLSGSWASSVGLTGAYDTPITLGPYPIAEGNVSMVVWDAANAECRASIVVTPPSTCSNQCRIAATASGIVCDDAQTPYDPSDDTFTFDLLVAGLNNAGPAWASAELGLGFFGQTITAGPFLIADGERAFDFRSAADEGCIVNLAVTPPPACSDACLLTITELEQVCDDGQTPFEADDDLFYYRIRVAGLNTPGAHWQASDGSAGAYGEEVVSAPQSLTGGERLVTLADGQGGNCATEFVLTPPLPEVVCPPATDRMPHAMNLQLLRGSLALSDTRLPAATEATCWLGADWAGNLPPAYDALRLRVPEQTGSQIPVYHFFLFSNIPAPAALAEYIAADGAGALFIGDSYYEPDPCCYLQSHPAGWASEGLVLANPYLDTTGLFVTPMYLVRRFSIRMTPGQVYTLMTTTWSDLSQGQYNWVILSEDELPPLELLSSNASSVVIPDARPMAFDLTYFDASWMMDNPVSLAALGEPAFDSYCGVDGWSFHDALAGSMSGCDTVSLMRSFDIATVHGTETCEQEIALRHPVLEDIILPPRVALFTCGDDYEVNEAGYPDPGEAGFPLIITSSGVEVLETGPVFNLVVNYKDSETQDTATTNVTREWTITNLCGDTLMQFSQLIKIGAFDPPRLDCPLTNHYCPIVEEDIMLFNTDPFLCTATLEAPWPVLAGSCGEGVWTLVTEILQVQGNDTLVLLTIGPSDSRVLNNWPLGDYLLRYTATDEGGNVLQRICRFRVADLQEPDPICRASLNAVLNGSGLNRLFVAQVDAGSYDNCGVASIELRRMFTRHPQTCDTLPAPYWGDWGPYVQFSCCDAGLYIMVEMRVTDLYGNVNSCWTNVLVEDKTLPYCTGLVNRTVSCDTLPALFNPYDTLQLQALFGLPQVIDNCAATAIELEPVVSLLDCGPGQIIRRFRAIDRVGNISAGIFQQIITISYVLNYALAFPADAEVDCTEAIPGVEVYYPGCDSITVEHRDVYLPTVGEECYYIERTYTVTNWCEWNGANPAVALSRDEDCDGAQGEERVWAIRRPDGSFVDRDSLAQNAVPSAGVRGLACNPVSNPQGHWREVVSTGRWTYTQRIMVFDTVAPVVAPGVYAPFCTVENACEATIAVPFTVAGECLPDTLSFRLLLDAGNDGDIDADLSQAGLVSGVYPDYILGGVFPIGLHRFELRVEDGCGNGTTISLPFEVVDCYIPDPVCFSGLIVNLQPTLPGVDADGDGDIDEAAVEVFAWQLASCDITDCSMPLRFSVNRPGETPDTSQTSIILTCEDRYRVDLEVYMWDSAMNPYAVQPNGVAGGPNYHRCLVEVLLRDTNLLCNDCLEQLTLSGVVHSPTNKPIENVQLRLTTPAQVIIGEQLSLETGRYQFDQLAYGGGYVVSPYKNDGARIGISALDLLAIQRHLLGDHPLANPYQLIAADVNNTRTVTTLDLVALRRLLLGDVEAFANNTSWRFVRADYVFPDPTNPWAAVWPEQLQVTNVASCLFNQNFIGIKIGDINGSATSFGGLAVETRSGREVWPLILPDVEVKAGETYRVALEAGATEGILAFQFGLDAIAGKAELLGVLPGALPATHLGAARLRQGQLTATWDKFSANALNQPLLMLEVRALTHGRLSELLTISSAFLKAEAYREAGAVMDIGLNFRQVEAAALALYPNRPNPFAERTLLSFSLPEAGKATLTVQDMTGAEVLRIAEQDYVKGYNELWINRGQLPAGAYTFTLAYGNDRLSRRMVVVAQ